LIAEHGQGLAAPESLAALVPATSKSALAVENRELDFGSATAPSQEELIFDEDENDLEIKVGDLVSYAEVETPDTEYKVKVTVRQTSPEMGLVSETTPLGSILVGAIVGETVVLRVAGVAPRSYLIKSVKRQSALES
jgi:transcription elongation GreA/GreB family factor